MSTTAMFRTVDVVSPYKMALALVILAGLFSAAAVNRLAVPALCWLLGARPTAGAGA